MSTSVGPPAPVSRPGARSIGLVDLGGDPAVRRVLLDHARRGLAVQAVVRVGLAVFVLLTVVVLPPPARVTGCLVLATVYLLLALAFLGWARAGGETLIRHGWLALLGDLVILGSITLMAGASAASWTTDVLVWGFFVVPLLASTQLRPGISSAVCVPTVALYLVVAAAGRLANGDEPVASILLRTAALALVSAGAVLLSRTQRSRVLAIGALAADRVALVGRLVDTERRERRELSERLHDGALQYLLAARMDLDDLRDPGIGGAPTMPGEGARSTATAFGRLDTALTESVRLLRGTVSDLHPAVLAQSGLRQAVTALVAGLDEHGPLRVELDADRWPPEVRTPADELLYATCRELLTNVVKHAGATRAVVTLEFAAEDARLVVADDGRGFTEHAARLRLADGHVGLAARRARVEAAGGTLTITGAKSPGSDRAPGSRVEVVVPMAVPAVAPYGSTELGGSPR